MHKAIELVIESHPGMPRRLPHGYRRPGHRRVGEGAKGDADKVRENFRIPEHRGAAVRAEMKFDLSPRVATAQVDLAPSLGADLLFWEIGTDAKGRAGTPLALRAVTRTHECRLACRLRAQRTAAAEAPRVRLGLHLTVGYNVGTLGVAGRQPLRCREASSLGCTPKSLDYPPDRKRENGRLELANYGSIAAHCECVSNVTGPVYPSGSGMADAKTPSGSNRRLRTRSRAALPP